MDCVLCYVLEVTNVRVRIALGFGCSECVVCIALGSVVWLSAFCSDVARYCV